MSVAQHTALSAAAQRDDDEIAETDRRTLTALLRHGWAERAPQRRKRERPRWRITAGGRAALAVAQVIRARTPIVWPSHWGVTRPSPNERLLEDGHSIARGAKTMLWRVECPAFPLDGPLHRCDDLAEAVALMRSHLCDPGRDCAPPPTELDATSSIFPDYTVW